MWLLTVSLLLVLAVPIASEDLKELEHRLRGMYEGKLVRLQPFSQLADTRLEIPKEVARAADPSVPIILLVEKIKLKKRELRLQARRIYLYQDIEGKVRGIEGQERKYRLRWRDSQVREAQLHESLSQAFPYLKERPEQWTSFWPPQRPQDIGGQPLASQPSIEIAPGVFTIGIDVKHPSCEYCPDPPYPEAARSRRAEGQVYLRVVVTESGRVGGIRLVQSAGNILLDQAAVIGVSRWRFGPAIRDGKPISFLMNAEINFRLH